MFRKFLASKNTKKRTVKNRSNTYKTKRNTQKQPIHSIAIPPPTPPPSQTVTQVAMQPTTPGEDLSQPVTNGISNTQSVLPVTTTTTNTDVIENTTAEQTGEQTAESPLSTNTPIATSTTVANENTGKSLKQKTSPKIPLEKSELVKMFLEMLKTIKLYPWNTRSYARHKATDELHEKLSELVDQFVEVMQGKMFSPNRIRTINEEIRAITPMTKEKMVDKILNYIEQLKNFDNMFSSKKDSDLLNIRDEMMAHLNQFLYLFSFDEI